MNADCKPIGALSIVRIAFVLLVDAMCVCARRRLVESRLCKLEFLALSSKVLCVCVVLTLMIDYVEP